MGYSSNTISDSQSVKQRIARVGDTARSRLEIALVLLLATTPLPIWAAANAAAMTRPTLKIYVSVDMEGIAGVVSGDQLIPPALNMSDFAAL